MSNSAEDLQTCIGRVFLICGVRGVDCWVRGVYCGMRGAKYVLQDAGVDLQTRKIHNKFEIFSEQNIFLYFNCSVPKLQEWYIQTLSSISFG